MIPLSLLALNTTTLLVRCGAPESLGEDGMGWKSQTFPYRVLSVCYLQMWGFALLS